MEYILILISCDLKVNYDEGETRVKIPPLRAIAVMWGALDAWDEALSHSLTAPLPTRALSSQMLVSGPLLREQHPRAPETRKSSGPHTCTHTLTATPSERVSRSALKVTAIRQLEDKWLIVFGGKEERLPPQRTREWLTAGWRETPGNINLHLTDATLTVLNRVYQGNTLLQ